MAFDALAYRGAALTIQSAVASLDGTSDVTFHLFTKDIPQSAPDFIASLFTRLGNRVTIKHYNSDIQDFSNCATLHGSLMVYARLIMPDEVPSERLIYLDSDLIITKDLTALWNTDLHDTTIGAVTLSTVEWSNDRPFLSKFGINPNSPYFNSGVLLIDSLRWRNDATTKKLLDLVTHHGPELTVVDQTLLNLYFNNNFTHLPPYWNQHVYSNSRASSPDSGIIHFLGMPKPWSLLSGHFHNCRPILSSVIKQQRLIYPPLSWSEITAAPGQFFRSLRSIYRAAKARLSL